MCIPSSENQADAQTQTRGRARGGPDAGAPAAKTGKAGKAGKGKAGKGKDAGAAVVSSFSSSDGGVASSSAGSDGGSGVYTPVGASAHAGHPAQAGLAASASAHRRAARRARGPRAAGRRLRQGRQGVPRHRHRDHQAPLSGERRRRSSSSLDRDIKAEKAELTAGARDGHQAARGVHRQVQRSQRAARSHARRDVPPGGALRGARSLGGHHRAARDRS